MVFIDFRDSKGHASPFGLNIVDTATTIRDYTMPFFRGYKQAKRPNLFSRIKKYNAQRLARRGPNVVRTSKGKRTYTRPSGFRGYKKKSFIRRSPTTKVVSVLQKNSYILDLSVTRHGYSPADSYFGTYYMPAIDSATHYPYPIPLGTPGTTTNPYVYGRLSHGLDTHIQSGNMAAMFSKIKVAWVKHTFEFPDQLAESTNDKWPLVLWVNHSDKWRMNIDGYGDSTLWSDADQLLERPGWKKFYLKRMNRLSITYKPTVRKTIEHNVINTSFDAGKMVPHDWTDLDDTANQSIELTGPTVCFQLPKEFSTAVGPVSDYWRNAFSSNPSSGNAMATFLEFSTVTVSAKVLFKDPDNDAIKGC